MSIVLYVLYVPWLSFAFGAEMFNIPLRSKLIALLKQCNVRQSFLAVKY